MPTIAGLIWDVARPLRGATIAGVAARTSISSILSQAVSKGYEIPSGIDLLTKFRDRGFRIRTQDFYGLFNQATQEQRYIPEQLELREDETPKPSRMPRTAFNSRTRYQYKISVMSSSEYRPEWGRHTFWYGSDELLTQEEALGEFQAKFGDSFDPAFTDWKTIRFGGAYRGKRGK